MDGFVCFKETMYDLRQWNNKTVTRFHDVFRWQRNDVVTKKYSSFFHSSMYRVRFQLLNKGNVGSLYNNSFFPSALNRENNFMRVCGM